MSFIGEKRGQYLAILDVRPMGFCSMVKAMLTVNATERPTPPELFQRFFGNGANSRLPLTISRERGRRRSSASNEEKLETTAGEFKDGKSLVVQTDS